MIFIVMMDCNEKCQLYFRCECSNLNTRCIFDTGTIVRDMDEYLERLTY